MDAHPLVRFVDGPAGRRARLVGGGDVWQVIAAVRDNDGDVAGTAEYLELPLGLVQAAVAYYGAYPEEVDDWIEHNEREAAEAHAAWVAGSGGAARLRLLLDEMLSPVIAQRLRERGHDVEAIAGHPLHAALSDREVMDRARSQGRAVVTNDVVDFRPLHHEAILPGGSGHFGIVFMAGDYRRTKAHIGRIATALEAKLEELPGERDLADGETWL